MRLLVLGGTKFVGRHMVEAALARGDEVTIFHRGKTNPRLFSEAEHVLGDREHDLDRLRGRTWDAAIDTCAYVPRVARISAEALEGSVGRYAFISSVSVYPDETHARAGRDLPVSELDDPTIEEVTDTTYGPLKVLCEREVERVYGDRSVLVRPTYVVGPFDPLGPVHLLGPPRRPRRTRCSPPSRATSRSRSSTPATWPNGPCASSTPAPPAPTTPSAPPIPSRCRK